MTRVLSLDIRERVVLAVEGGLSRRSAAKRFGVAASTAIKWIDRWRRTGDVGPRPQGGDRRSQRIEAHSEEILALIDKKADITLGEITEHLEEVHGLRVAQSTVWRLLDRHGMTFKKTARASEQQRADVLQHRQAWFDRQPNLEVERLVFIDETGASGAALRSGATR
jgi:transposase